MSAQYIWVTNAEACDTCKQMAMRTYTYPPDRPHKYCLCSIVHMVESSARGKCVRPVIEIISAELLSYEVISNDELKKIEALYHEWEFTAACRDNSLVIVRTQVELKGGMVEYLYNEINAHGFDRGFEISMELAKAQAIDEIVKQCGPCKTADLT